MQYTRGIKTMCSAWLKVGTAKASALLFTQIAWCFPPAKCKGVLGGGQSEWGQGQLAVWGRSATGHIREGAVNAKTQAYKYGSMMRIAFRKERADFVVHLHGRLGLLST